ncbi:hypothetical protein [Streptomyces sp. NPDC051561]|uniref:hypothetical protein n=1 Tax=Streptomyces sp. NPDC051561 TaxID=3365658 RepID=UPI0037919C35
MQERVVVGAFSARAAAEHEHQGVVLAVGQVHAQTVSTVLHRCRDEQLHDRANGFGVEVVVSPGVQRLGHASARAARGPGL